VPANLAAQAVNGDTIRLTWDGSVAAGSYRVYYDLDAGVERAQASFVEAIAHNNGLALQTIDLDAQPSARVVLAITAVSPNGDESALSSEVVAALPDSANFDPLFGDQWHLVNTGQGGGTFGEDANIAPVHAVNILGDGVRIAVVDDGLEIAHEDLLFNVPPGLSFNYLNGSSDPTGGDHGTECAGVAAAIGLNDLGGMGAAPEAQLVGYNLLLNLTTANEANAMTRSAAANWISSNSWGATDGLGIPQRSNATWRAAIDTGLATGRNGLGLIYVWAAGNGGLSGPNPGDNSNSDGQANYFGVIAVGAVGDNGEKASYSENGANLLLCAPSMGDNNHGITTVDRTGAAGVNDGAQPGDYLDPNYTNTFNGTSSSTPLVAGVAALVLEAAPGLTWRDLRLVLARSARQNDAFDPSWITNGAGVKFSHKYGFGCVDAEAAVAVALTHTNVGSLLSTNTPDSPVNLSIPDNNLTGVSDDIVVAGSGINFIEHVEVRFDADDHPYVGDLQVVLVSPSGSQSVLSDANFAVNQASSYDDWVFGTNVHLDEPADGTWTLVVRDLGANDTGTFNSWGLRIRGRN
jgi:kexin